MSLIPRPSHAVAAEAITSWCAPRGACVTPFVRGLAAKLDLGCAANDFNAAEAKA